MADRAICSIDGCGNGGKLSRGWCRKHYATFLRNGDPLARKKMGPKAGAVSKPLAWLEAHSRWTGVECLNWPFSHTDKGYARIKIHGVQTRASRVMCRIVYGEEPFADAEAAHSCGKGHEGCVNPRHLRWATRQENAADAVDHGTWSRGERLPQAKLTEEQVREIRQLGGSLLQREIAGRFGISRHAVRMILSGKNWAWLQ